MLDLEALDIRPEDYARRLAEQDALLARLYDLHLKHNPLDLLNIDIGDPPAYSNLRAAMYLESIGWITGEIDRDKLKIRLTQLGLDNYRQALINKHAAMEQSRSGFRGAATVRVP